MTATNPIRALLPAIACCSLASCAQQPAAPVTSATPVTDTGPDRGILWVRDSAEYAALALQAYTSATKDLRGMMDNPLWSALPDQTDASGLPPAIIFDVDETLVTNVLFQAELVPPFTNRKLDEWNAANAAVAVPGAARFVKYARTAGVEAFFVTNRPCEPDDDGNPCPQKDVTIGDLNEAGIPADESNVMMANELPEWTGEKKLRRDFIAQNFRVIMLIGDDLGDFIPCVRARANAPCTEGATQESRKRDTETYAAYWGNGWYVVPNPMHGSWTSVR
jgi:5'-nucleotidase (lipoprotein e(P4) family)